jgi:hypothetical protein
MRKGQSRQLQHFLELEEEYDEAESFLNRIDEEPQRQGKDEQQNLYRTRKDNSFSYKTCTSRNKCAILIALICLTGFGLLMFLTRETQTDISDGENSIQHSINNDNQTHGDGEHAIIQTEMDEEQEDSNNGKDDDNNIIMEETQSPYSNTLEDDDGLQTTEAPETEQTITNDTDVTITDNDESEALLPSTEASDTAELPELSDEQIPDELQKDSITEISVIEDEFGSEDFLSKADALIEQAMSAILNEYGQEPVDYYKNYTTPPMFAWHKVDLNIETKAPEAFQKRGNRGQGGWTSPRSWKGLLLRLLQALSTRGTFTVVLGGHSAAAGHGNHFKQSYLMQFHKVMEPVFRRLGVTLMSRNQAQGGLGTIQTSLGSSSLYGDSISLMLWDSGMTENHKPEHIDLFFRQALMSENRVPVVWAAGGKFNLLRMLHNEANADVGEFGLGLDGIAETRDEQQVKTLPWAVQHLKCSDERPDLCKAPYKFCATCWIPRSDKILPQKTQYEKPHGQVKWHPGWRSHQLTGRVLAFAVLEALKDAVQLIRAGVEELELAKNMSNYYESIRSKVQNLDPSLGLCYRINTTLPGRVCRTPMKGRTQYTPRPDPEETSLTSIVKAAPPDNYVPRNTKPLLYDGPDAHNPCFDLPEGAVDVVARILDLNEDTQRRNRALGAGLARGVQHASILENGRQNTRQLQTLSNREENTTVIEPGRGWEVFDEPQGTCDGTLETVCAKSALNRCVLYGHHDGRGAVIGSELAGWLVLQLPRAEIQQGIIIIKLHSWHEPRDNVRTKDWKSVNNIPSDEEETDQLENEEDLHNNTRWHLGQDERGLRHRTYETPPLPDSFAFEYAIDGEITSWNRTEFLSNKQDIQQVTEVITLLDDPSYFQEEHRIVNGSANTPLEVAIRLRGCFHRCVFGISHIYWA